MTDTLDPQDLAEPAEPPEAHPATHIWGAVKRECFTVYVSAALGALTAEGLSLYRVWGGLPYHAPLQTPKHWVEGFETIVSKIPSIIADNVHTSWQGAIAGGVVGVVIGIAKAGLRLGASDEENAKTEKVKTSRGIDGAIRIGATVSTVVATASYGAIEGLGHAVDPKLVVAVPTVIADMKTAIVTGLVLGIAALPYAKEMTRAAWRGLAWAICSAAGITLGGGAINYVLKGENWQQGLCDGAANGTVLYAMFPALIAGFFLKNIYASRPRVFLTAPRLGATP